MKPLYSLFMKSLILLFCFCFFSCASFQKSKEPVPPEAVGVSDPETDPTAPFKIFNITTSRKSFNPSQGDAVTISFYISRPAKALFQIFDPDSTLVRELIAEDTGNPGFRQVTWDGKDMEGNIVPDEAYFFTIEANDYRGDLTNYDPMTFFNEESFSFPVEYDSKKRMMIYDLAKDSRALIRAGITQGPLLKTIVAWGPRPAGVNEEPWDGKDASGVINAANQKALAIMSDAVTLPEKSILAFGNTTYSYFEYKNEIASDRPVKEERTRIVQIIQQQDFQQLPVRRGIPPLFSIELPENAKKNEQGQPIVNGKLPIKIYLDEKAKKSATERRYEIICYVDYKFITEQEEGYSPSTWMLDTKELPDGLHTITVNVATLDGEMTSGSCIVYVQNES